MLLNDKLVHSRVVGRPHLKCLAAKSSVEIIHFFARFLVSWKTARRSVHKISGNCSRERPDR